MNIDWNIVELQGIEMRYENEIYEALEDRDFDKLEKLVIEYNEFRKDNKKLF